MKAEPLAGAASTQGIKYAGSKRLLLRPILDLIAPLGVASVLDGFAGSTRVAQALSQAGYRVVCNDVADWSRVFGKCYLQNQKPPAYYQALLDHLNALPGVDGWFSAHYGGRDRHGSSVQEDGKKRIWQFHNTRKLDAVRPAIDRLTSDEVERSVLLTSLILALDKVDSSMGHQASYLRAWSPRSYRTMQLAVPRLLPVERDHEVHQVDAGTLAPRCAVDLAYYDPPYGSANAKMPPSRVRYASYYHLWTTIIRNDRPELVGAAHRRRDASDGCAASAFEEFRRSADGRYRVMDAIQSLLCTTRAHWIVLSYSSGARLTLGEMVCLLRDLNLAHRVVAVDHRRNVMAAMRWTNEWVTAADEPNREYLFLIER